MTTSAPLPMTQHDPAGAGEGCAVAQRRSDGLFVACVVVGYALLVTLGIARHEIWRDEAQAWLIARDVTSVGELFHVLRYEGHPALWYLLLYPLAKYVTHSPVAMQVLHGAIATAAVFVFVRFSPFTRLQKVLWCFGYYSLFEYGVISRNYSLGALVLWTLCAIWPRRRTSVIAVAVLLALLANANAFAGMIAVGFAVAWLVDAWWRGWMSGGRMPWVLAAIVIVVAGWSFAAWTVRPERDALIRPAVPLVAGDPDAPLRVGRVARGATAVWRGYVPLPHPTARTFWNTNLLRLDLPYRREAAALLSAAIVIVVALRLRGSRATLATYLVSTALIVAAIAVALPSGSRHVGHLLLAFIACAWIVRQDTSTAEPAERSTSDPLLTTFLAAQFVAGVWAMWIDFRQPFSSGDEAARWLAANGLADAALVGDESHRYTPLAAQLDAKLYYPARRDWGSFALLDRTPKEAAPEEIATACRSLLRQGRPVVLIAGSAVPEHPGDLHFVPLATFTGSVTRESYHLFRVSAVEGR